jgi:hypothetical protein
LDELIATIVAVVLGGFVLAAGLTLFRLWRAAMREKRPLLMHRVLEREAVSVEGCTDVSTITQIAAGMRRCLFCRDWEICVAWLNGDIETPLNRFCPNAELIARLKSGTAIGLPGAG